MASPIALDHYRLLGRSGLRVSPMALGTMTFGTDWGWGADEVESRRIFDSYVDRGGNFIDTANFYTNGTSEKLLGQFLKGQRDRAVLATKYSLNMSPDDPNAGGNHRKSMVQAVENSLKRLDTDYIDLLYVHAWDNLTPPEEIMRALDDLVRAGKINYVGISDTPAWQVARMQSIADLRGWAPFIALQIEYNLVERTVEAEQIPMATELGLGVLAWSPLASGVLTGKYTRADLTADGSLEGNRRGVAIGNGTLNQRSLDIADIVREIAEELCCTPAQLALAWTFLNPAVTGPIVGARTFDQFKQNLGALDIVIPHEYCERLENISKVGRGFPHDFLALPMTQQVIYGTAKVRPRHL